MTKHIEITALVQCSSPDELPNAMRANLVTHNDEAACQAEFERSISEDRDAQIREYGFLQYDPAEGRTRLGPHAVLRMTVRGYCLTHNPNEYGCYIQCSPEDASKISDGLGPIKGWRISRYGSRREWKPVLGLE